MAGVMRLGSGRRLKSRPPRQGAGVPSRGSGGCGGAQSGRGKVGREEVEQRPRWAGGARGCVVTNMRGERMDGVSQQKPAGIHRRGGWVGLEWG